MSKAQAKRLRLTLESGLEAIIQISPYGIIIQCKDEEHDFMTPADMRYLLGVATVYEVMIQRGIVPHPAHVTGVAQLMVDKMYEGVTDYFRRPGEMSDKYFQEMMKKWEGIE